MSMDFKALGGAGVVAYIVFYLGIQYFYGPILAANPPAAAIGAGWMTLAIATIALILCFGWVVGHVGSGVKAGLIIAVSQVVLVDFYYPLNGTRSWIAAGASAVLLCVGWFITGMVYDKLHTSTAPATP